MAKMTQAARATPGRSGPPDPRGGGLRERITIRTAARSRPRRIGFLLIPDFAVLAYACAMEPYRAANALAERELYAWRHISHDGRPVRASNGLSFLPDQGTDQPSQVDDLIVCAGGNPTAFDDAATFAWLRAEAARGIRLGGVSGGPEILARCGLLDQHRCTAHWEYIPSMRERYPNLVITRSLYEIDRDRCTCSGGTAALDMAVALISAEYGSRISNAVAEWFLHTRPRAADEPQRMSLRERYEVRHAGLLRALAAMEEALEAPMPRTALAALAGVSVRQLERLFTEQIGSSIGRHYLALRLDHARRLLRQTSLSVIEIALACGFSSAAHFSRAYRARFGKPPRGEQSRVHDDKGRHSAR